MPFPQDQPDQENRPASLPDDQIRALVDTAPAILWMTDETGAGTFFNRRWEELTGQAEAAWLGHGWLDAVHAEDRDRAGRVLADAVEQCLFFTMDCRLRDVTGAFRWVMVVGRPRLSEEGVFLGHAGSMLDITERKEIERDLRTLSDQLINELGGLVRLHEIGTRFLQEGRLSSLLQEVLDASIFFTKADKGLIQLFNPAAGTLEVLVQRGFSPQTLSVFDWATNEQGACLALAKQAQRLVVEDLRTDPACAGSPAAAALLAAGVQAMQSIPLLSRTGQFLGLLSTCFHEPRRPSERMLCLVDLFARQAADLIQHHRTEGALRESEARLNAILQNTAAVIYLMTPDNRFLHINREFERLFGVTNEAVVGQSIADLFPPEVAAGFELNNRTVFREGRTMEFEERVPLRDGVHIYASVKTPLMDAQGAPWALVGVSTDMTDRKKTESQRWQWTQELERSVAERTRELVASRERLRGLAAQLTLAEQRERQRLATDLHDYLAQLLVVVRMKIQQAYASDGDHRAGVRDADRLLGEALNYTRSLVATLSPPVLHQFGLVMALQWLAEQKQLHGLEVTIEADQPVSSLTEDQAILLFQSVRELLFNVVKHARASRAAVSIGVNPAGELQIAVQDDGCGFDLTESSKERRPGSGFGHFSIRERMEAMGGRFDVQSAPGRGTRALLAMPCHGGNPAATNDAVPAVSGTGHAKSPVRRAGGLRVLLADDHALVRQGLRSILEGYPELQVVGEAMDGQEAVELAGRLSPDVVVMDINMPRLDGVEATKRLKREQPSITVVGLSVHQDALMEETMRAAGAAAYLTKDSAADQLYRLIRSATSSSGESTERP